MKKFFVFLFVILNCFKGESQISKGLMMIGGSLNSRSSKQKDGSLDTTNQTQNSNTNKNASFGGSLRCGKFITDHFMVGIFGAYQRSWTENDLDQVNTGSVNHQKNKYNTYTFSGGLFARYYKMLGKSRFACFGQINAGYGAGKSTNDNWNSISNPSNTYTYHGTNSQVSAFINLGMVYFITNHIAVEASFGHVGYNWAKTNSQNSTSSTSETINDGFNSNLSFNLSSLSLGINFYFGGNGTVNKPTEK